MTYKLLALDVDGTLFNSKGYISLNTKGKIDEVQQRGVMVTLATGRHYPFARAIAKELQLYAPIITHDGNYIAYPSNNQVYYVRRISYRIVAGIVRLLVPLGLRIMILHESESITNQKFDWKEIIYKIGHLNALRYYLVEKYNYKFVPAEQLSDYILEKGLSPPKVFVMGNGEKLNIAKERILKRYAQEIHITTSGDGLHIIPIGNSKGNSLRILGEKLGIDSKDIIAIGDHYNDLEMLRYAGLGVAMGNAPQEIQAQADFITRTNDEDGIAHVIDHFIL